jgi:hypothetical protein
MAISLHFNDKNRAIKVPFFIIILLKINKNRSLDLFLLSERVSGIEPPSSAWKADIINHYTIPAIKIIIY